jgi:predicted DNA-binding transcriptional regulator YafY
LEILGLVASGKKKYGIGDLAELFKIDEESIKKDLAYLRSQGVPINQVRSRGIRIDGSLIGDNLSYLLSEYLALTRNENLDEKQLHRLLHGNPGRVFGDLVLIQRSIRAKKSIDIRYEKRKTSIGPLLLFEREGLWRLLAIDGEIVRQFILKKITEVGETNKPFKRPSKSEIESLFSHSWQSWIGKDRIRVKLLLSDWWAERLDAYPVVKDQRISKHVDGKYIFEGSVNSIMELARWVVARGGEVVALEPKELVEAVRIFSENCLKKHKIGK